MARNKTRYEWKVIRTQKLEELLNELDAAGEWEIYDWRHVSWNDDVVIFRKPREASEAAPKAPATGN